MKASAPPMPIAAMSARPVARPSIPSMRLKALTAPTIQNVVSAQSSHTGIFAKNGTVWSPAPHQKNAPKATAIWPSNLTNGGKPNLSSASPTTTSTTDRPITRQMTSFGKSGESCAPVMDM